MCWITNPGRRAPFYPNANSQNDGRGNPGTRHGWRRRDIVTIGAIALTTVISADPERADPSCRVKQECATEAARA
ncbi:hypothetical protein [Bradyrhizobium roseum]|uniref:hypothetical protein n=1 Tax=Bradyrhizobium roseum TaxID=3056648 RepID=UPI00260E808B|nr:hypothetical protein [Bradyrhizobium roseus]WKA31841.1 hypothetical protein QUH67_17495 [Bradyrhizobium roseus]